MSMLSAQIDKLREYATRADGTFSLLVSTLRDAADTIWQLRDDLQQANAENTELRELVRDMYKTLSALDIDYCGPCPQDNVLHPCPRYTIYGGDCKFETAMRELGVEVD